MKKRILILWGVALLLSGASYSALAQGPFNDVFSVDITGAHRGIAVNQNTGWVYISNTSDRDLKYFTWDNQTATADGSFQHPDWNAWLGPYGIGVADDGMVYVTSYRGTASGIHRATADGSQIDLIAPIGESSRGLCVTGGGVNTAVYSLNNDGDLYKTTTDDGSTFTFEKIFSAGTGINASVAATIDGNTIYTAGFGTNVQKWDGVGNEDATFVSPATNAVAVALNQTEDILYVATTGDADNIIKYDLVGGAALGVGTLPVSGSGTVVSIDSKRKLLTEEDESL